MSVSSNFETLHGMQSLVKLKMLNSVESYMRLSQNMVNFPASPPTQNLPEQPFERRGGGC